MRIVRLPLIILAIFWIPLTAHGIEIQEVESPGGIRAWLIEDHTIPLISVDYAFAGAQQWTRTARPDWRRLQAVC